MGNSRSSLVLAIFLFLVLPIAVTAAQTPKPRRETVHTYYIAADEVTWNYAPRGRNLTGIPTPESDEEGESAAARLKGKVYLKAIYREYTDATFKTLKPRPPQWDHLGILGPLIRAEVGDTVKVFFKNNTKIFCTMHPHGLWYTKDSEGALYNDGTSGKSPIPSSGR